MQLRVKPVTKDNLSAQLYHQLRSGLMEGLYSPGERLTIAGIAEAFGTSITPVREAIFRLVSERALEMRAATSINVPQLDVAKLREIQLIRIELEGAAAARAAEVITEQDIADLVSLQVNFLQAARSNPRKASLLNREFHFALLKIAQLPMLESVVENMWVLMGPFLRVFHDRMPKRDMNENEHRHFEIIEALRKKNSKAARKAMQQDILWGEHLIAQLEMETHKT